MSLNSEKFTIQAYSCKELRNMYSSNELQVNNKIWAKWIKPLIDQEIITFRQKIYTAKQVEKIVELLGIPSKTILF